MWLRIHWLFRKNIFPLGLGVLSEATDESGASGREIISQSTLVVDEATGASEWQDRIFLYDGFPLVGAVSGVVGGEGERAEYPRNPWRHKRVCCWMPPAVT